MDKVWCVMVIIYGKLEFNRTLCSIHKTKESAEQVAYDLNADPHINECEYYVEEWDLND